MQVGETEKQSDSDDICSSTIAQHFLWLLEQPQEFPFTFYGKTIPMCFIQHPAPKPFLEMTEIKARSHRAVV